MTLEPIRFEHRDGRNVVKDKRGLRRPEANREVRVDVVPAPSLPVSESRRLGMPNFRVPVELHARPIMKPNRGFTRVDAEDRMRDGVVEEPMPSMPKPRKAYAGRNPPRTPRVETLLRASQKPANHQCAPAASSSSPRRS
jgi:hypothetical protein